MKTSIIITLMTMSLFSFTTTKVENRINHKASQNLADQVLNALKQTSSSSYADLAPTVEDFKKIMADNADAYSGHLAEAQEAFVADYLKNTMPSIKKSFDALIENGRKRGINWSNVTLLSWETVELVDAPLIAAPFSIAIESGGKIFKIEIEKALYINGHWCVSQYVKLI